MVQGSVPNSNVLDQAERDERMDALKESQLDMNAGAIDLTLFLAPRAEIEPIAFDTVSARGRLPALGAETHLLTLA
jgi:hypothetical protein